MATSTSAVEFSIATHPVQAHCPTSPRRMARLNLNSAIATLHRRKTVRLRLLTLLGLLQAKLLRLLSDLGLPSAKHARYSLDRLASCSRSPQGFDLLCAPLLMPHHYLQKPSHLDGQRRAVRKALEIDPAKPPI